MDQPSDHFLGSRHLILEGIVTTLNADQGVNISPMGPIVDRQMQELELRPYQTSTTYQNLKRHGEGVFHVTDNVDMLARCAVGSISPPPTVSEAPHVSGRILTDACRWYEFRVLQLDDSQPRTRIRCEIVGQGRQRDFFGFNRAKHAVLEAAILATRIGLIPREQIELELERLQVLIEKTAGDQERSAFEFLRDYVHNKSKRQP